MSFYDYLLNGLRGKCSVDVKIGEQVRTKLPLIVVNEKGSNLLGLDWSDSFGLTNRGNSALLHIPTIQCSPRPELLYSNVVKELKLLSPQKEYNNLFEAKWESVQRKKVSIYIKKYNNVFEDKLGKCTKKNVSIYLKDGLNTNILKYSPNIVCNKTKSSRRIKQT